MKSGIARRQLRAWIVIIVLAQIGVFCSISLLITGDLTPAVAFYFRVGMLTINIISTIIALRYIVLWRIYRRYPEVYRRPGVTS